MIRYYKYQCNSNIQSIKNKWFLRVKHGEQIDIDKLAEHMSEHNTPFSKGAIKGILTDMVACIKELLLDSKTVKLADLAIFSLGIHCKGCDDPNNATVQNIRAFTFRARGTGELSPKVVMEKAHLKEMDQYSV